MRALAAEQLLRPVGKALESLLLASESKQEGIATHYSSKTPIGVTKVGVGRWDSQICDLVFVHAHVCNRGCRFRGRIGVRDMF